MRTRLGVIALAMVVTACGSSAGPAATTVPASSTTVNWAPLLLTAPDVGSEWKLGADINSADLESFPQIPCGGTAVNPTIAKRLVGVAGVQFEPVDTAYRHAIEMVVTGEPTRLATDIGVLVDAIAACQGVTVTVAGSGTVDVSRLSLPALGDQRAGFVMKTSVGESTVWYGRSAIVRVGPRAVLVGLTEILSAPATTPHFTDAQFIGIVTKAVAKLA